MTTQISCARRYRCLRFSQLVEEIDIALTNMAFSVFQNSVHAGSRRQREASLVNSF